MKSENKLRETTTICCVCGGHINGPWPAAANLSHGYCKQHYHSAMREIQAHLALMERRLGRTAPALAA